MFITMLRRNIGTVIAGVGFTLLCIMTFGNLGEIVSDAYWENVRQNITSIGFMSLSLTLIHTTIKQGLAEQALQRGLNSENTTKMYEAHRALIKEATEYMIYLPYFLQIYNKRNTELKKREFLINNNYVTEAALYASGDRRLIGKYKKIRVNITARSIKWVSSDIVYNKYGQILTLEEHRRRRTIGAFVSSLVFMFAVTFIAKGLFFSPSGEPLWQKFVKLLSYVFAIAIGSLPAIVKEYEKGAYGVPNDLAEINEIWTEFKLWTIPDWVKEEVDEINQANENKRLEKEAKNEERKRALNHRTTVQGKQEEGKNLQQASTDNVVPATSTDDNLCRLDDTELSR